MSKCNYEVSKLHYCYQQLSLNRSWIERNKQILFFTIHFQIFYDTQYLTLMTFNTEQDNALFTVKLQIRVCISQELLDGNTYLQCPCNSDPTFFGCLRKSWKSCFVSSREGMMSLRKQTKNMHREWDLTVAKNHITVIDNFHTDKNLYHQNDDSINTQETFSIVPLVNKD